MLGLMKGTLLSLFALSGALFVCSPPARAANVNVDWDAFGFSTLSVTIIQGDTVTWRNLDHFLQDSFTLTVDGYFPITLDYLDATTPVPFPTVGTYSFTDGFEEGTINVNPPNAPPTVTITNPANNAVFSEPATFVVQADATDDTGVYYVEFYRESGSGPVPMDNDFDFPYASGLTNLAAGTHTITAVAYDINGAWDSDSITITVVVPPAIITLSNPRISGGTFLFDAAGFTTGKTHILEYSTNLSTWIPVTTNVATSGSSTFTNSSPSSRFYRVLELSNSEPPDV
jgi:hypothetical protein